MRSRQNWLYLVLLLIVAGLVLVACERPLPGGYNDPEAGLDTSEPDVPVTVPEVGPETYPADAETTAPEGAAAYPANEAPPEQGVTAGEEQPPETGETQPATAEAQPEAELPAVETPAEVTPLPEEAPTEGAVPADATAGASAGEVPGTHTVVEGENLYRIGLLYGVSWLDLAAANDIADPANLTVGQVLIIPTPAGEDAAEATEQEPVAEAEATAETGVVEEAAAVELPTTYIVQQGDNLFRIGVSFGVSWTEIVAANGITGNEIYPGQELIIPAPAGSEESETAVDTPAAEVPATPEVPAAEAEAEGEPYTVQEGDTIFSVAFLHGIPWTRLVEANSLEAPYTLEAGRTLIIPAGE